MELTILVSLALGFIMGFLPLYLLNRRVDSIAAQGNAAYADMHDLTEKFAHMNAQLLNNQTIMMGFNQAPPMPQQDPQGELDFDLTGGLLAGAGSSD